MAYIISLWERILCPDETDLSPEVARFCLSMNFSEADQDRCEHLSYRAQEGALTNAEAAELDNYLSADSFLIVLHAKARRSLNRSESTKP